MRREDIHPEISAHAFDSFYWFSRFEFALKENGYLQCHKTGATASPGWNSFVQRWQDVYVASDAASRLVEAKPNRQVVLAPGVLGWEPVNLSGCKSKLDEVVVLLKTVRNNLFHGGKHGAEGWDDAARMLVLLQWGKVVLDELARMASIDADYLRYY